MNKIYGNGTVPLREHLFKNANKGDVYIDMDTNDNATYIYDGDNWVLETQTNNTSEDIASNTADMPAEIPPRKKTTTSRRKSTKREAAKE